MSVARLLTMPVSEIAGRTRQAMAKLMDRMTAAPPDRVSAAVRPWAERFASQWLNSDVPFFPGALDASGLAMLADTMPAVHGQTLQHADSLLEGEIDLLGYRGLRLGEPIDWHLDPLSGQRAPLIHFSRIDPLATSKVGDAKLIWELNRLQWLISLAQAWALTRDERYSERTRQVSEAWLNANPRGYGINWTSSLEAAMRLIAWCWVLHLLRGSRTLTAKYAALLLDNIAWHAAHIERYLSTYFSPNTHLTCEALGLLYAGVVLTSFDAAPRWRELARRILVNEIERQVLPDGVYFEQSTGYARYTAECYLQFHILARTVGMELPAVISERLQLLLDFLLAVRQPNGAMPMIGDADGGWLLPLVRRKPADLRGVMAVAAALFSRSDYAWASGVLQPETIWLLGAAAQQSAKALYPCPPPAAESRLFPHGGWVVFRGGAGADAHQLLFDVGPLGCPVSAGHGHADLLGVQCCSFGEPVVVDPGTFSYAAAPWRDAFRSSSFHSTVTIDGAEQAEPRGPFVWRGRPAARLLRFATGEQSDFAAGEHRAYGRHGVVHRRQIHFVKPGFFVIADDVTGRGRHRVEVRFQLAPLTTECHDNGWVRATSNGGPGLMLSAHSAAPFTTELRQGEQTPPRGWVSPDYGVRLAAPLVVFTVDFELPIRVVTVLWPVAESRAPAPTVVPLHQPNRHLAGLRFPDTAHTVWFES